MDSDGARWATGAITRCASSGTRPTESVWPRRRVCGPRCLGGSCFRAPLGALLKLLLPGLGFLRF
jgi:hypothetical protein